MSSTRSCPCHWGCHHRGPQEEHGQRCWRAQERCLSHSLTLHWEGLVSGPHPLAREFGRKRGGEPRLPRSPARVREEPHLWGGYKEQQACSSGRSGRGGSGSQKPWAPAFPPRYEHRGTGGHSSSGVTLRQEPGKECSHDWLLGPNPTPGDSAGANTPLSSVSIRGSGKLPAPSVSSRVLYFYESPWRDARGDPGH